MLISSSDLAAQLNCTRRYINFLAIELGLAKIGDRWLFTEAQAAQIAERKATRKQPKKKQQK